MPDQEHQSILTTGILPAWTKNAVRQERPVVVFVAGQPGSGKSAAADLIHGVLDRRGGAVRIGSDLYKAHHPWYRALLAEDDRSAGVKIRPDTRRWQAEVEQHARRSRFDAVVETALGDVEEFRAASRAYREAGYRIEVAALATPEAWSQLRVLDRYVRQVHATGAGRYVSWENHDGCSDSMLETLSAIESEVLADRVTILRRSHEVLYGAELAPTARGGAPAGAVSAERVRPWSARETLHFRRELSGAEQRLHDERISDERRRLVRGDVERAWALAEPVRRIAQARREPPGVDFHRLSAAEHRWIFDELIVPSYLGGIVPQERPVAVYVLGQPGAGKSQAADLVQHAMAGRGATRIAGDDLKPMHPDYHQLLREQPRTAGEAIRADYRAWRAEAEAYVRARRGDVVVEAAPGSGEEFRLSAARFAAAGYRIEVVALAVRAADSRQGTARRFVRAQQLGVPARFTTRSGHDACYAGVAAAVRSAEGLPAVGSLLILHRDLRTLYRNERARDGSWRCAARGAAALDAERTRPYTAREAASFLSAHRALRAALPQYRAELEEIASLARATLPTAWQPRRLPRPRPAVPLLPARYAAAGYGPVSSR
ncbi:ATP/GTP-binding protein [Streptomyces armeniacus]|uniref:UDP-N-acetylglucosamine kinase n=1 Tax=Streptomyces armeniacus TaxID=83291 RepID=A0A345Y1P8_9ACTN|nr:ATP/GTP-binding protein [Streptomyces armeniacus]